MGLTSVLSGCTSTYIAFISAGLALPYASVVPSTHSCCYSQPSPSQLLLKAIMDLQETLAASELNCFYSHWTNDQHIFSAHTVQLLIETFLETFSSDLTYGFKFELICCANNGLFKKDLISTNYFTSILSLVMHDSTNFLPKLIPISNTQAVNANAC